jgi:hypothetical protein
VDRGILWKLEVALGQQKSAQACFIRTRGRKQYTVSQYESHIPYNYLPLPNENTQRNNEHTAMTLNEPHIMAIAHWLESAGEQAVVGIWSPSVPESGLRGFWTHNYDSQSIISGHIFTTLMLLNSFVNLIIYVHFLLSFNEWQE